MVSLIDGQICHTACGIPFDLDGRDHGDRQGVGQRFFIFVDARFLFIDEVSMISAELDHTMERVIREATEPTTRYKRSPDGSIRLYGGLNVMNL